MIRVAIIAVGLLFAGSSSSSWSAEVCQEHVNAKQLPMDFKVVSRAKLGPAELVIVSNGKCTCNDTPAVQRSIGQPQPDGVFWACEVADADDTKAK